MSQFSTHTDELYTRIVFVRHGRTDGNTNGEMADHSPKPLNTVGRAQIEKAAARIARQFKPDILLSSPLPRAWQSAEIIAAGTGLKPIPQPLLAEFHFGKIAGLTLPEIKQIFPDHYNAYIQWVEAEDQPSLARPEYPQGETFAQITRRVWEFTNYLKSKYLGKVCVAVSHGGFIKCALQVYTGGPFDRSVPYWIDNASITVVDFYKNTATLRLVNDTCQISEDLPYRHPSIL